MKNISTIEELKNQMPRNPGSKSNRLSAEGIQEQFDVGVKMREQTITIYFFDDANVCRLKFNQAGDKVD